MRGLALAIAMVALAHAAYATASQETASSLACTGRVASQFELQQLAVIDPVDRDPQTEDHKYESREPAVNEGHRPIVKK